MDALAIGDYVMDVITYEAGYIVQIFQNGDVLLNGLNIAEEPYSFVVPKNHKLVKVDPE